MGNPATIETRTAPADVAWKRIRQYPTPIPACDAEQRQITA